MPGILSTMPTSVGLWFWTQLVSPLLTAPQSVKQWLAELLRPARGLHSAAGTTRAPIGEGPADLPHSEVEPEAGPCLATVAQATPQRSSMPLAASPETPEVTAKNDNDFATGWHGIGAELAAGLSALQSVTGLDSKAAGYVTGLQILRRQVASAAPQVLTLATGTTWGARRGEVLRAGLIQSRLPVADTLHRGRQALASEINQSQVLSTLWTLYTQIAGQLQRLLTAMDVREIDPLGQRFDRAVHEASYSQCVLHLDFARMGIASRSCGWELCPRGVSRDWPRALTPESGAGMRIWGQFRAAGSGACYRGLLPGLGPAPSRVEREQETYLKPNYLNL